MSYQRGLTVLSYGTPQARASRAPRAPLRTELIYTFRDGLNFGEGILNIQVATTALIQVSLYFSDAQITKMFVVNQDVQNAKIDLCHAAAILS